MESGCDDYSPTCWCPCGCGCMNDPHGNDLPFTTNGLCRSCADGRHEIPAVRPTIADLIAAHESCIVGLKKFRDEHNIKPGQNKYGEIVMPVASVEPCEYYHKGEGKKCPRCAAQKCGHPVHISETTEETKPCTLPPNHDEDHEADGWKTGKNTTELLKNIFGDIVKE